MTTVSCGTLLAGRMFDVGTTLVGPGIGIVDYSKKTTNDFGVTTLVERPFSDRTTLRAKVESKRVDVIKATLAAIRAIPTLFIGDPDVDSLIIYGWAKSFDIDLQLKTGLNADVSFELENLI